MVDQDPKHDVWNGWYFEGEYFVDDCGNKHHPLKIKACDFDIQRRDPGRILWHRPSWDD